MKTIYLMFTGLSLSGKTWLLNGIEKEIPQRFFRIDSRSIHDYLNQFDIFKDGNSIDGFSYELRQDVTDEIQKVLIKKISEKGISIAHDACNRVRSERKDRLNLVKKINSDIITVIIFVNPEHGVIESRAQSLDLELEGNNREPVWHDLYLKQLQTYEVPDKNEADFIFEYTGGDIDNLVKSIKAILS